MPKYDRSSLRIDYTRPVSQAARPTTADGLTSFHFKHSTICKGPGVGAGGVDHKSGPGAAARHGDYIEREGAVARIGPAADLAIKPIHADETSRSYEADAYITRDAAVAAGEAGTRVLFTNISPDAGVRRDFWHKAERIEREPGPSTIRLHVLAHGSFWQQVRRQKTCPTVLRRILDDAKQGSEPYVIPMREAKSIRAWLKRQPGYDKANPPATIRVGRAGHVQYRIHGSLPVVLSPQGRIDALRAIAADFENRRLPYVAVLHAPDHNNDERNWHYHIVYHDRPIELMLDGRWDFETRKTAVDSRGRQSSATLAQPKVREVAHRDWVPNLRDRVSKAINAQLAKEGHALRLDPRSHDEMGISEPPQESLGSKASALEKQGIATAAGTRNADRYWAAEKLAIEERFKSDLAGNLAQQRRLQAEIRASSRPQHRFLKPLGDITSEGGSAASLTRQAALTDLAYRRDRSRADFVIDVCTRQLDAIARDKATTAEARQEQALRQRLAEAQAHLDGVERAHAAALAMASELIARANRHKERRDESRDLIKRLIAEHDDSALSPPLAPDGLSTTVLPTLQSAEHGRQGHSEQPEPPVTNNVEAAMTKLALAGVRIRRSDEGYRVDGGFLEQWGVAPPVITSESMQRRLAAMATVQDRELTRLQSYTSRGPTTVVKANGAWRLATTAPAALRIIDEKWAADDLVQQHREKMAAHPQPLLPPIERATERHDDASAATGVETPVALANALPPAPAPVAAESVDYSAAIPMAGIERIKAMIDKAVGTADALEFVKRTAEIRSSQLDVDPARISSSASKAFRSVTAAASAHHLPPGATPDRSASRDRQLSAAADLPLTAHPMGGNSSAAVTPTTRAVAAMVGRMFHHVDWAREDYPPAAVPPTVDQTRSIRSSLTNALRTAVDRSR